MASYSYLLATNTKEPCGFDSHAALQLRTGENQIPLLWFGCFRTLDVNKHTIECVDELGETVLFEAMTMFCRRRVAVEQFEEFANRLLASHAMGLPAEEHLETMMSDLKCVDCYAFQLDCSELQLVVGAEEFDTWLSRGLEFTEKISSGAWSNMLVLDERKKETLAPLFEGAHIYPHQGHDDDDDDSESERETSRSRSPLITRRKSRTGQKTVIWECANWEHSLVGLTAPPFVESPPS